MMLLLFVLSAELISAEPLSVSEGLLNQLGIKIPTPDGLIHVSGVSGSTVELPCNITSPQENDSVRLVLWFKEEGDKPIYTYDTRGGVGSFEARHYSDDKVFKGRAYFRGEGSPGRLVLEGVTQEDAGQYKCRTDFHHAPTKISVINLNIVIPPEKPYIHDESSNRMVRLKLGPYREGDTVKLRCEVLGGNPAPEVTWWRDHTLLDTSQETRKQKVVNRLVIEKISRIDLHSIYTCQASNNNVSVPVSTSVKLDLTYGPETVKIVGMKPVLSAGVQYRLQCMAAGGRPAPQISWYRGDKLLEEAAGSPVTSPDGKVTTGTLLYTPDSLHNGEILKCRAGLSNLPGSFIDTTWNLSVHYIPDVKLEYGRSIDPHFVKENDDVYFECRIKSNPYPRKIYWKKDGKLLNQDKKNGILLSNQTLVLQHVLKPRSGLYTCSAENTEGTGESNPLPLEVKFSPECSPNQIQVYGVAKHETARVRCEVIANPEANLRFTWKFNTSRELLDIQESQVTSEGRVSWLEYTPRTELDYGTLLCSASNQIGEQSTPCGYRLIPAGRPDSVENCVVDNQTFSSLHLRCNAGFDGGLEQSYFVEVLDVELDTVVSNISTSTPTFSIIGLDSEREYMVSVVSINEKGRSSIVQLTAHTTKPQAAERHTDQAKIGSLRSKFAITPILGILIGIGSALTLVSLTIIFILCCRSNYEKVTRGETRLQENKELGLQGEGCRGPDIIPPGEEVYKQKTQYRTLRYPTTTQDMDMLRNIHHNIQRLNRDADLTDISVDPYSSLLPVSSCGSSRDDDSPHTPLVSEDGRSSSSSHQSNLLRLDRESAV